MKDSILRNIQVFATFALFLGMPSMSAAATHSFDERSGTLRVTFSDLDLTSDAGIATLYRRLQRASEKACDTGSYIEKGSIRAYAEAQACFNDMLDNLVAEVNNAKLTAVHES